MKALKVVQVFFPKVKSVKDATKNALIEVTPRDIASSQMKNHKQCAMAVACKRKFHLDGVIISRSVAYLIKGKAARRFKIPVSVAREVVSFDRGAGFAPGRYSLQAISPANRLGIKRSSQKESLKHKDALTIPRRFQHLTANVRSVLGGAQSE